MDKNESFKDRLKVKKKRLLDTLIYNDILKDERLIKAFIDLPLKKFIPEKFINPVKLFEKCTKSFLFR